MRKSNRQTFQPRWLIEMLKPQQRVIRPATVRERKRADKNLRFPSIPSDCYMID